MAERPRKEYVVSEPKTKAFMVEDAQWERLQERVANLEREPSLAWLTSAASTAISVAISAVLAIVVLPSSEGASLGPGVRPTLWAIAGTSFALAATLSGVYFWARKTRKATARDICAEMDTIHEAWAEREE